MGDEDKYTEREFSEKFEELRWNLLSAYHPVLESPPQAFLIGGQSGAGKTTLHKIIHRRLDGNGISINGTTIESFTPASWSFSAFTGTKPLITPRHGRGA